jgi:transcriptional regulator with XRE-family HTH domain
VQIPNLRDVRELQGLTQKELADVSNVSLRSVAGYESGARVRPNTARKLAKALDVEVAELVGVSAHPKARALLEDEVLFETYYGPESFEEVMAEAMKAATAKRHQVPEGMQIAMLYNGDKVEVRIVPVSPTSRIRRERRATTKTRNNRKTA